MDLLPLERLMATQVEGLTYVVFFGGLVGLGLLERALPRDPRPADHRRRWPANFGLTAINIVVLGALPLSGLAVADLARAHGWGLFNAVPPPAVVALVAGFLVRTLVGYAIHLAMHKVPLFWRLHRVHHTDRFLDVSSTVRFHPLEFVIATPLTLAAILALGLPPLVLMLYEILDAAMAVWTHANIRLPDTIERALRLVIVTPDLHRVHHSAWQPETDSNYGATLSCWDRLFGTLRTRPAEALQGVPLGLNDCPEPAASSLVQQLLLPFRCQAVAPPRVAHGSEVAGGWTGQ